MFRKLALTIFMAAISVSAMANQAVQGDWEGTVTGEGWNNLPARAEIVGQPNDGYRARLYIGDMPAVELSGLSRQDVAIFIGEFDLGDKGRFVASAHGRAGEIQGELISTAGAPGATLSLKRVVKESPTLGQKPPKGAVVLLGEGASEDAWIAQPGNLVNGEMRIGGNTYVSRLEYGDAKIHVEFMPPYMPNDSGQARGNSGVYVHGRYEIQVLDSYADAPDVGTCGAIYSIAVPPAGACLPPGQWQTYDITFKAPKFDANGKKVADGVITVLQNGKVIYDDMVLPHVTPGGISGEEAAKGPLMLQNHGDEVRYRNVWVLPL